MHRWVRIVSLGWLALAAALGRAEELPAGATPLNLVSAPRVSADGKQVVFEWLGDIWTAGAEGGEARRVVEDPARDAYPCFSPDGSRIVFSSERSGSLQVYSIPSGGGEMIRHSWHSEGSLLEGVSPCGSMALVRGPREFGGPRSDRLLVVDLANESRERRIFDASGHSGAWSPDGGSLLFCRGGEQFYRKGYRGARAAKIWRYDLAERHFELLVDRVTESLWPMWLPDGKGFYYVSGEGGVFNIWLRDAGGAHRQITFFEDDGVIMPSLSADGETMVFRKGFEVLLLRPASGDPPRVVRFWTRENVPMIADDIREVRGCDAVDFSADLLPVFSAAGELWRLPAAVGVPVRLTETAFAEEQPQFSRCGESLYFLVDDGLESNYYRARWMNGALADSQPVTRGPRSKGGLLTSPDGSKIAWVEGTGDVHVAAADGGGARRLLAGWNKPAMDWSPDGNWLALAVEDRNGNRDLFLADAEGAGEPLPLTRHPAFDGSPRWSPDGRWLAFTSRRDESGELGLWRIDFGPSGLPSKLSAAQALRVGARAQVIRTRGIEPTRLIWSADSKEILFQSRKTRTRKLFAVQPDGQGFRTVVERRGLPVRSLADGSLIWRVDRNPEILRPDGAKTFPISLTVTRPRHEVLTLGFRRIWRTIGERFYDAGMHGRDWQALRVRYEAEAVASRESRQFYRVVRQMLGELNASHLAFHRAPWPEEQEPAHGGGKTWHPGMIFDDQAPADGPLRVKQVVPGSPAAKLKHPPLAGEVLTRIAGEPVSNRFPVHRFFQDAESRIIPVTLRDGDGRERVIELRCLPYASVRSLLRVNRETLARQQVAEADPKAAYIAVPDMNLATYQQLALEIYQTSLDAERLILDFRNNGGGREADRMLGLLCQPVHSFTIPRNGPRGYPHERRPAPAWTGPLVVLCNADTYSNAEIFCHAVQLVGRAPLVGTGTAGGVISAISTTIPDAGRVQVPFRGWFRADDHANLDLNGAQPDYPVDFHPAAEAAGRDPQLEKAIKVLMGMRDR
jgi:Tol biopolymer transport system component/C-terminal processing protease CtpA/Prc